MTEMNEVLREKLLADLKSVLADTEELVRLTAGEAGGRVNELRGRLEGRLASVRAQLGETELLLRARTREAAQSADEYVREHPWQSVGAAAGISFLLGLLIGRR